jgi:hypothetical protein
MLNRHNVGSSIAVEVSRMKRLRMAVSKMDRTIEELVSRTDHRQLAIWAADCAERVLPYFEKTRPGDDRPRKAIETVRAWARTGVFKMSVVRKASLAAHAAAREVEDKDNARSAARAAGQAVATVHVPRHALAAAVYAATAVRDSSGTMDADAVVEMERRWQYIHLLDLAKQ